MERIELLAPAGTKEAFVGAINAGANAIFMAGYRFGARAFAENFTENDLIEAISYAHLRDVLVYVVVNTLIYNDETADLIEYTDMLVKHGVDGLIVQDIGMIDLFCKRYPDTAIHASTQSNVHSVEQVAFLKSLGVKRVILARETTLDVIKEIKAGVDIEVEVFIHGALCVSYSGQCLISSILNNRSGNRGQCAYNCRLPYQLLKEDEVVNETSYLMSTKDLMTIDYIDELVKAGVDSLKIEGRMRKKEYVSQTVAAYKEKIDAYYQHKKLDTNQLKDLLKRTFNRQYTKGFMFFESPKEINNNFRPNHLGIAIGEVLSYEKGMAKILLSESLRNGDGFRIIGKSDYGNTVTFMRNLKGEIIKETKAIDTVYLEVKAFVEKGAKIHKTSDSKLENDLSKYQADYYKVVPLSGVVYAYANKEIRFVVSDYHGHEVTASSKEVTQKAKDYPTTAQNIHQSLNKLGATPFYFDSLVVKTDDTCFIPVKTLNELRRQMIEKMVALKTVRPDRTILEQPNSQGFFGDQKQSLIVKVRTKEQLEVAYEKGIQTIYYEDILKIKKEHYPNAQLIRLTNRIRKPKEKPITETTVIGELGVLYDNTQNYPLIADEFINVTNIYTAKTLSLFNVKRVTLSSELDRKKVLEFADVYHQKFGVYPHLEYVVYGYKDLMISKYCPVAKTFDHEPKCGLCFKNQYYLENEQKDKMALLNDGHCNMRVMDMMPTSLIAHLNELKKAHIHTLRLDFTIESEKETRDVIEAFLNAWQGYKYVLSTKTRLGHYTD